MFPLRVCGGKLLVAVIRERRYGPSRLRVNDDDDDDSRLASRGRIAPALWRISKILNKVENTETARPRYM